MRQMPQPGFSRVELWISRCGDTVPATGPRASLSGHAPTGAASVNCSAAPPRWSGVEWPGRKGLEGLHSPGVIRSTRGAQSSVAPVLGRRTARSPWAPRSVRTGTTAIMVRGAGRWPPPDRSPRRPPPLRPVRPRRAECVSAGRSPGRSVAERSPRTARTRCRHPGRSRCVVTSASPPHRQRTGCTGGQTPRPVGSACSVSAGRVAGQPDDRRLELESGTTHLLRPVTHGGRVRRRRHGRSCPGRRARLPSRPNVP